MLNVCIHDLCIALLRNLKFRGRRGQQRLFVLTALHPQEQVENPWPVFYARLPACADELRCRMTLGVRTLSANLPAFSKDSVAPSTDVSNSL